MGLKTNIIVRNEFTYKLPDGSGTRGATPGDFIMGYMAREGAGEAVTPVRLFDSDDYILRYMAREEAVDEAVDVPELRQDMRDAQKWGGQAFGYGSLSLSHEGLKAASADIQKQFDSGKTVLRTVISFDQKYLEDNNVVDDGFTFQKRGDYRGHIDQMRLRTAIDNGVRKLYPDFDDLRYVGLIQVDTAHVHCHLCMVDAGIGNLRNDGLQKGMLTDRQKQNIRRGIDMALDENQMVRHMAADVDHDKRNALCFIKRFTHRSMEQNGLAQFLISCLPEDERLWRAGTNNREMRKPNAIVREYVTDVLSQPGSGYNEALKSIASYAKSRQEREGLTEKQRRQLYENGKESVITECMNGVYAVLKQVPHEERTVRTAMLDIMSEDYETLASRVTSGSDEMIEFGFRLRSYSARMDHHKKEKHKYDQAVRRYEASQGNDPASRALLDFFAFERDYNAKLMCKYQYFLDFLPPADVYQEGFDELMDYRSRIRSLDMMQTDKSLPRMGREAAEEYGLQVYGQHGGSYVRSDPEELVRRRARMVANYQRKEEAFSSMLGDYGMSLEHTEGGLRISRAKPYGFDDVKALDIHHLSFDFPYDINISRVNIDAFINTTYERARLYDGARDYLVMTDQGGVLKSLSGKDIRLMKQMAERLDVEPVLDRARPDPSMAVRRGPTIKLDRDLGPDMSMAIRAAVHTAVEMNRSEME